MKLSDNDEINVDIHYESWIVCFLSRLCIIEVSVYVEQVKLCNVINEGLSMYRYECEWNYDYVQGVFTRIHTLILEWMNEVQGVFTRIHTLTLEWMNEAKVSQKGIFGVNTLC